MEHLFITNEFNCVLPDVIVIYWLYFILLWYIISGTNTISHDEQNSAAIQDALNEIEDQEEQDHGTASELENDNTADEDEADEVERAMGENDEEGDRNGNNLLRLTVITLHSWHMMLERHFMNVITTSKTLKWHRSYVEWQQSIG